MTTSKRISGMSNRTVLACSILLLLLAIGVHSAQYLPETPRLFVVVFFARLTVALSVAFAVGILWLIIRKVLKNNSKKYGFWTVFGGAGALTAIIMMLFSINNEVPEGLLQLYL